MKRLIIGLILVMLLVPQRVDRDGTEISTL